MRQPDELSKAAFATLFSCCALQIPLIFSSHLLRLTKQYSVNCVLIATSRKISQKFSVRFMTPDSLQSYVIFL